VPLSIDSGFVRSCTRDGPRHFEVTVGRCERCGSTGESFGFVSNGADPVHEARWQTLLARQGHRPGESLTVLSDGAEAFLNLAKRLGAKHVMDSLPCGHAFRAPAADRSRSAPESPAGSRRLAGRRHPGQVAAVAHGQVRRAGEGLEDVEDDMGPSPEPATPTWNCPLLPLRVALWDLQAFLRANESHLVNYGERYRRGERISTAGNRIDGQPGHRPADRQETADALEPARRPPSATDPGGRARRELSGGLPKRVSEVPGASPPGRDPRMTPRFFPLSQVTPEMEAT
jgi:hypothetical protein